jgi:hypothetical protein
MIFSITSILHQKGQTRLDLMGGTKNPLFHGCIISILRWPLPILVAINPAQKVALIAVPCISIVGRYSYAFVSSKPIVPRGACIYCFLDCGKRSNCHQYFTPSGSAKATF